MANTGISSETLVAMHETAGIGWKTIRELWDGRGDKPIREGMREADLRDLGLRPKVAAALAASLAPERMEARREMRRRAGIEAVTWADREFPDLLQNIPDPPAVLYCIGRLELLTRPMIAVVGTRLATAYGRHVAEEFSAAFSDRGLTVVSGLARGNDTAAHRGALNGFGGTIAVLGTPVDRIYPPENRQLYEEIAEKGLLLSEAPPGTPYHKGMFPSRNRIISGLSHGLVVVEAPFGSGALLTVDFAVAQERPVFIVPGPVTSPRSKGGLHLLREGTAEPLVDPEDVLSRFAPHIRLPSGAAATLPNLAASAGSNGGLTEQETLIYDLLLDHPRSIDELTAETGMSYGQLNTLLLALQFKRKIRQSPGSIYEVI